MSTPGDGLDLRTRGQIEAFIRDRFGPLDVFIRQLQGGTAAVTGAALNGFVGAWSTSTPTATQSVPFTVAADGTYLFACFASAYHAAGLADVTVEAWVNGVLGGAMKLFANPANQHQALVPAIFTRSLTKGTSYLHYKQTAGTSNAGDYGGAAIVRLGAS